MRAMQLFILTAAPAFASELAFLSFGPTFHWNFGKNTEFSGGLEFSYWGPGDLPTGIDVGIEIQSGITRLYSEFQFGLILAGASAGPVLEFRKSGTELGMQATGWLGLFLGADYRYRWMSEKSHEGSAKGVWVKIPKIITQPYEPALY